MRSSPYGFDDLPPGVVGGELDVQALDFLMILRSIMIYPAAPLHRRKPPSFWSVAAVFGAHRLSSRTSRHQSVVLRTGHSIVCRDHTLPWHNPCLKLIHSTSCRHPHRSATKRQLPWVHRRSGPFIARRFLRPCTHKPHCWCWLS